MSEAVQPSGLATQPIGEASRVVDGVYQLKLPVPFPLKFIASYIIEDNDGWTVIDPGFDYPPAREVWETEAERIGLDLDWEITRVIVTHLHPDHIGLARWLEERSGAPVWMLEDEISNARYVWNRDRGSDDFAGHMKRHGMDAGTAGETAGTTRPGIRLPERLMSLHHEDRIELGGSGARVIHTPGHSDFHFVLHDEARKLIFAGDHLLLEITPNIGLWTYTAPSPLERYLTSIKSLRGLDADVVFPGHGPLFHDLDGRIDELVLHHEERLSVMHDAFAGEPATAFEIALRVFPDDLSAHQLRFAVAETLAHLEHLADGGRAGKLDGDVVRYEAL